MDIVAPGRRRWTGVLKRWTPKRSSRPGNRDPVPPGLVRHAVTVRWRLGATNLEIVTETGLVVATDRLAPAGAGQVIRRARWFELDLPDVMDLRRRFFADAERRTMLAGSVLDDDWHAVVAATGGPWFFAAEAVLIYLDESEVEAALRAIGKRFPGSPVAFDTWTTWMRDNQDGHDTIGKFDARFRWFCDDPRRPRSTRCRARCPGALHVRRGAQRTARPPASPHAGVGSLMKPRSEICTITGEVCGTPRPELRKALEAAGVRIYAPFQTRAR